MSLQEIIAFVTTYIPVPVIIAIILNIFFVYMTQKLVCKFENWIEEKKKKQIKIFDHKKIWLSVFWCVVLSVVLACTNLIEWKQLVYYMFIILGASTFCYEAFLKKIGINEDN